MIYYSEREKEALSFFGFDPNMGKINLNQSQLKTLYREMAIKCHPDKGGLKEDFLQLTYEFKCLNDLINKNIFERNETIFLALESFNARIESLEEQYYSLSEQDGVKELYDYFIVLEALFLNIYKELSRKNSMEFIQSDDSDLNELRILAEDFNLKINQLNEEQINFKRPWFVFKVASASMAIGLSILELVVTLPLGLMFNPVVLTAMLLMPIAIGLIFGTGCYSISKDACKKDFYIAQDDFKEIGEALNSCVDVIEKCSKNENNENSELHTSKLYLGC